MTTTTDGYSLQPLGDGWFRVSGVRVNPTNGRYITSKDRNRMTDYKNDGMHAGRAEALRKVLDDPETWKWSEEDLFNEGWDACVRANFNGAETSADSGSKAPS